MARILTRRAVLKAGAAGVLSAPFPVRCGPRGRFRRDPRAVVVRRPRPAARLPAFFLCQPAGPDRRAAVAADHRHQRQPDLRHLRHAQRLQLEGQRRSRNGRDVRYADDRQRRRARFGLWPARPVGARLGRQTRLPVSPEARGALLRRIEGHRGRRRLLPQRAEGQGPSDLRPAPEGGRVGRGRGRRRRACALHPRPHTGRPSDRRRHAGLLRRLVEGARLHRRHARPADRVGPLQGQDLRAGPVHRVSSDAPTIGARNSRSISARTISTGFASNITASGRLRSRRSRPARSTTTRSSPRASGPPPTTSPPPRTGG